MAGRSHPHPSEMLARRYRRAHERLDREAVARVERGGFGYADGFHGAYAERREYAEPRGLLRPAEPERSGWPSPIHRLSGGAYGRHLGALRDRDLARAVDFALYETIGEAAARVAVYANDAVITLEGPVPHPAAAAAAEETARAVPGVREVRSRLWVRGLRGGRFRGGRAPLPGS
ncbi:MAG TPA: BON domain-containing protein [Longimicrobiales bacterium]